MLSVSGVGIPRADLSPSLAARPRACDADTDILLSGDMHIIVCIKQVPDTADVKIDPRTNTLVREGVRSIVNPFDLYAVEEALRLREKFGGHIERSMPETGGHAHA